MSHTLDVVPHRTYACSCAQSCWWRSCRHRSSPAGPRVVATVPARSIAPSTTAGRALGLPDLPVHRPAARVLSSDSPVSPGGRDQVVDPPGGSVASPQAHAPAAETESEHQRHHSQVGSIAPRVPIPPSDRVAPAAVASFVVVAWANRGFNTQPFLDTVEGWITPDLESTYRRAQPNRVAEAPLTQGDIVRLDITSHGDTAAASITVEQLVAWSDRTEPRVVVVTTVLTKNASGWRVAALERS